MPTRPLALALALSACASEPTADSPAFPATIRLPEGGIEALEDGGLDGGLEVEVTAIADSRCPPTASCVWEGDAAVTVQVSADAEAATLTLHTAERMGPTSAAAPGGYTIALAGVEPPPGAGAEGTAKEAILQVDHP